MIIEHKFVSRESTADLQVAKRKDLEEKKRDLFGWCCANGSDEDGDTSTCHHGDPSGAHVSLYMCVSLMPYVPADHILCNIPVSVYV